MNYRETICSFFFGTYPFLLRYFRFHRATTPSGTVTIGTIQIPPPSPRKASPPDPAVGEQVRHRNRQPRNSPTIANQCVMARLGAKRTATRLQPYSVEHEYDYECEPSPKHTHERPREAKVDEQTKTSDTWNVTQSTTEESTERNNVPKYIHYTPGTR